MSCFPAILPMLLLAFAAVADEDSNPCLHPRTRSCRSRRRRGRRCRGACARRTRGIAGCGRCARNVVELRDAQGAVTYAYSPFGACVHAGPSGNPVQFSSEIFDPETALVHYRFREYSPALGRWLSPDPAGHDASQNLYAFVDNNPINFNDALGLELFAIDGTGNDEIPPTNVRRFFDAYKGEEGLRKFYYRGIGNEKDYSWVTRKIRQGTSWGITDIHDRVVTQICTMYCQNRSITIDLVGFSRGAAIAKEVAETLSNQGCCCGELLYVPGRGGRMRLRPLRERVNVRFLGLFDPVYSTMAFRDEGFITDNVQHSNTILAAHETRFLFTQAKFANENTSRHRVVMSPGIHSDVGGFYDDTDIYRATLRDMMEQAAKAGVEFDAPPPVAGKNYHFKSNKERKNDAQWGLMDGPRSFHPSTTIIRLGP